MFNSQQSFPKSVYIFFALSVFAVSSILCAEGEPIELYTHDPVAATGGVAFNFYQSGYSDGFWWGETDRHSGHGHHEMLSGEFGAAVFYNNIATAPNAMWLQELCLS